MAAASVEVQRNLTEILAYANMCTSTRAFFIFARTVFTVVIVPIILGNVVIMISVFKFKSLHKAMYILIGNLAVADLLLGASLLMSVAYTIYKPLQKSKYLCLTQYALVSTSLLASAGNILLMAIERFIAVKFPFQHRIYSKKITHVGVPILIGWLIYISTGFLPMYGVNRLTPEVEFPCHLQLMVHETFDFLFMIAILSIITVTLTLCVVVFCIAIGRRKTSPHGNRKTIMMLVVFCVFAVSWSPYIISATILRISYGRMIRCVKDYVLYIGILNSAVNWIIYGALNPKIREAFRALICCCRKCKIRTK